MTEPLPLKIFSKINILTSFIIFSVTLCAALYSHTHFKQLEVMQGMAEEYVVVAYNLYNSGEMYFGEEDRGTPFIFRPPGYIYYLSWVYRVGYVPRIASSIAPSLPAIERVLQPQYQWIYFCQAVLLAASAVLMLWWLRIFMPVWPATVLAAAFGLNPYLIILTGLLHYETLHVFAIMLSGYVMTLAYRAKGSGLHLFSGLLWGCSTLVRPTSLILPAFHLIGSIVKWKGGFRRVLLVNVLFCAGMAAVVLPYTLRNHQLTGEWIPVNAQAKAAMWHSTRSNPPPSPNHYNWWRSYYPDGYKLYQETTGNEIFTTSAQLANAVRLENAYGAAAWTNFRRAPLTYLKNGTRSMVSFLTQINSVNVKIFQALQLNQNADIKRWLIPDNPQIFHNNYAAAGLELLFRVLSILALAGFIHMLWRRDGGILPVAVILLCFTAAVGLTLIDFFYYYVKIPLLYIFAGYFLAHCGNIHSPVPKITRGVQQLGPVILLLMSINMCSLIIFS